MMVGSTEWVPPPGGAHTIQRLTAPAVSKIFFFLHLGLSLWNDLGLLEHLGIRSGICKPVRFSPIIKTLDLKQYSFLWFVRIALVIFVDKCTPLLEWITTLIYSLIFFCSLYSQQSTLLFSSIDSVFLCSLSLCILPLFLRGPLTNSSEISC